MSMRGRLIAASAAILSGVLTALAAGLLASPAAGVTNLYAPQQVITTSTELMQFSVAADGSLTPLAPATLPAGGGDLAITPDGRFGYVSINLGADAIVELVRGAAGRMDSAGSVAALDPAGILVNPQGTRIFHAGFAAAASPVAAIVSRPIDPATGDLGAPTTFTLGGSITPRFLAMNPAGTSLYVGDSGVGRTGTARIRQLDVDPATGAMTPKTPAFVDWPTPPIDAPVPVEIARMAVTPDGAHLYAASGESATGLAHFAIDALSGALVGGSLVGLPADGRDAHAPAITPDAQYLFSATSPIRTSPGRIDPFSIGAGGALSLITPPMPYPTSATTRDGVVAPNGRTLYLGQDANVSDWVVGAGATLTPRGNASGPLNATRNAGLALSPSQPPVASFTAAPKPAGQATTFNAAASVDPDGTVARYDWIFGDGTTLPNGGPVPSHAYGAAGTFNVTLTVTDADGTSTAKLWTGSRMLRNGGPSAQVTLPVSVAAAPPPPPAPPGKIAPERNRTVTIEPASGIVKVKLPGSRVYVDVRLLRSIPLGSTIDARKGHVVVTVEVDAKTHETQSTEFWDGIFKVTQTKGPPPILVATLVGGTFKGCTPAKAAARSSAVPHAARGSATAGLVQAAAKKQRSKRKVRRLWGNGKGDFRTTGRRSSATVRGTFWLVEDRCDGTLSWVRRGRVDVRDFRLRKTIKLRAGQRYKYLAKAP
jgi:PKD repeat protein/6-phosphogluconolactonase (cycloisomerase 2 family)